MTAMLGGSAQVQVLGRPLHVTIEPNSGAGTTIRRCGHGLSDRNGARGDLTLQLMLAMPSAARYLTDDERNRLREIFEAARRRTASSH